MQGSVDDIQAAEAEELPETEDAPEGSGDEMATVPEGEPVSLRALCGRSSKVRFRYQFCWF